MPPVLAFAEVARGALREGHTGDVAAGGVR